MRNRVTGLWLSLIAAGALLCLGAVSVPPPQAQSPQAELGAARARLIEHFSAVQDHCRCAGALQARLDSELARIPSGAKQSSNDAASLLATLESSLIEQLVSGQYRALDSAHGSAVTLCPSSLDASLQPLSVFVPESYDGRKNMPLIVLLHGADQSENELLSLPQLRRLANTSGVILALPWARGDELNGPAASSDVYDALDAVEKSYAIDHRRVYLAGLSLGGIALFQIGPLHPERWTAFLSIAGTLTNGDLPEVEHAMRGKQVFLVAGASDTFVKPAYIKAAAAWMTSNGIESHYYEQPGGEHNFVSLDPSIQRAWQDMLSGVRMTNVPVEFETATPQPTPTQKK